MRALVGLAVLAAGAVGVPPVSEVRAAPPSLAIPGRVYPPLDTIWSFSGTDPISGDDRAIQVSGLVNGTIGDGCNPSAGNDYEIGDCPRIQMTLGNAEAGLLRLPDNEGVDITGDGEPDRIIDTATGAVIEATDLEGGDSVAFSINGTQQQISDTLAKLQFVPCKEQDGTLVDPAPPAGENPFEVDCGVLVGGDPADEPVYIERESADGLLPSLSILAIQGDGSGNTSGSIYLKFENTNTAPTLTTPAVALDVAAGDVIDVDDALTVVDDEMCNELTCGPPFTNPGLSEGDDEMLLVAWIREPDCGRFGFLSSSALTDLGGPARPSVRDVLRAWTGLALADPEQSAAADQIATAVEADLPAAALALDLSTQPSNVDGLTTVFAGVGALSAVRNALSGIDYEAPGDDATCHLDVAVSDLGNNGLPESYEGSPFGPEAPHVGHATDDVPYEIPAARADTGFVTFDVSDGRPDVTVSQLAMGQLGDPAGPNKPAVFRITFSEAVEGFDSSDYSIDHSDLAGSTLSQLVAVVPGLEYTVAVTSDRNGTLTLEIPEGAAHAAGHGGEPAFASEAPTDDDNEIEWDQTGPEVTINRKATQPDPTNTGPIVFTVEFSDTISTAPIGFTAEDVVITGTANADAPTVVVTQPSLIDLKTYEVSVDGMDNPGTVIANVVAGAILDTAGNNSSASTSTDNSVQFDAALIGVSIDDRTVVEGDSGTTLATFTVSLDEPASGGEQVTVATANGTASAGSDYDAIDPPQVLTFAPGETSRVVSVTVDGDTSPESDETFTVALSAPSGLTITDASGTGTITNDDILVTITPSLSIAEGDSGTVQLTIQPADHPAFGVVVDTSDQTAEEFFDYSPLSDVTFNVGAGAGTFDILMFTGSDGWFEGDETFLVTVAPALVGPPGFTVRTQPVPLTTTVTIQDDDPEPVVSVGDVTVVEGATANVPVQLANTSHTCIAGYTMQEGSATDPEDFLVTTGQVTLDSGDPSAAIAVTTVDDSDIEVAHTFTVTLTLEAGSDPECAPDTPIVATVTIVDNDDPTPSLSIADASVAEGTGPGTTTISFAVATSGLQAADCGIRVVLSHVDTDDGDFGAPATFDLTAVFETTDVTIQRSFDLVRDFADEPDETFTVTISGESVMGNPACDITTGDETATGTIVDDDLPAVDNIDPTVDVQALTASPTSAPAIEFSVEFSEPVTGFGAADVQFGGTALPGGATLGVIDADSYTLTVTGMTQSGTVTVSVPADVAQDAAANGNVASNVASVDFVLPPDVIGPTVTIDRAPGQDDPTDDAVIEFAVTFNEPVADFATGDVTIGGTANPSDAEVTGSGTNYIVAVSGMTQSGTVTASVPAGVAHDAANNPNSASTSSDNVVEFEFPTTDTTPPTVTIEQAAAQADPTTASPIEFTAVFSEEVSGFAAADVTLGGSAGATTVTVAGLGTTYTVSVSGMSQSGTVTASIVAGAARDAALNPSAASTSSDNSVTYTHTMQVSTPGGTVSISVLDGGQLTAFSASAPQVNPPSGVTFPFGQLSFSANSDPGGLVTFQIVLPSSVNAYYKLNGNLWQAFTFNGETGAQVNGNVVTVTIRDNGRGDSNPASGVVTDPGAPAVTAQAPPTGSGTTTTSPNAGTGGGAGGTAATGASSAAMAAWAAVLVVAGLLLLDVRRRGRRALAATTAGSGSRSG